MCGQLVSWYAGNCETHCIDRKRDEPRRILAKEGRRKRYEGDRHQKEHVSPDQPVVPPVDKTEYAMMPDPISANHKKAQKETNEFRDQLYDRSQECAIGRSGLDMRNLDLDHKQSDRDGENRVAEKDYSFELQFRF